jgi:hypothetical protein
VNAARQPNGGPAADGPHNRTLDGQLGAVGEVQHARDALGERRGAAAVGKPHSVFGQFGHGARRAVGGQCRTGARWVSQSEMPASVHEFTLRAGK